MGFSDSDWAGNLDDRKYTSGGCFYLGSNFVSWHCKKQNSVSLSYVESEHVTSGSCETQLIWVKNMLHDFGLQCDTLLMFCDDLVP